VQYSQPGALIPLFQRVRMNFRFTLCFKNAVGMFLLVVCDMFSKIL